MNKSAVEPLDLAVAGLVVCNSILLQCCSIKEPSHYDSTLFLLLPPVRSYCALFKALSGGISWRKMLSGACNQVEMNLNRGNIIMALTCLENILVIVEKVANSVENWFGIFEVIIPTLNLII
jgi:hypothetical protein